MADVSTVGVGEIVDSLSEGVYVCDLERRITFWGKSAERITGWPAAEVVGRQCFDNVLCHVDKDGHRLCGEEYCPLHRAMVTGVGTPHALLVYAQGKDGKRIPMHVSTAPLRDETGRVIGGVETFRDASGEIHDLERAKAIQRLAMQQELPEDHRVSFTTHYIPHDIIGGDYLAVRKLDERPLRPAPGGRDWTRHRGRPVHDAPEPALGALPRRPGGSDRVREPPSTTSSSR